jgi:hypothetical protein
MEVPETDEANTDTPTRTNIGSDFNQANGQVIFGSTSTNYNAIRTGWIPDAKRGWSLIISTTITERGSPYIAGTVSRFAELITIDSLKRSNRFDVPILVYGHNMFDTTVKTQSTILMNNGFTKVFVYVGGMFEWMLLHKLYGNTAFPIVCNCCNAPNCLANPSPLIFSPVVDRIVNYDV